MKKLILHSWLLLVATISINAQQNNFPKLTGPYFGQKPPGMKPEIFAAEIISSRDFIEAECTWSPDLKEFYFSRSETMESEWSANFSIWYTQELNGVWTKPRVAPFSGVYRDFYPFMSRDGNYMIFYRMSNVKNKTQKGSWISERKVKGWSEPKFFVDAYCLNTNDFKTFYFTTENDDNRSRDIGVMQYENGVFSEAKKIKGDLNTKEYEAHGVISPNGDYILFNRSKKSTFVSFRQDDGTWGQGLTLNASYFLPAFSPDGKYIFFKKERDIYWVSTEIIEMLRSKELKNK